MKASECNISCAYLDKVDNEIFSEKNPDSIDFLSSGITDINLCNLSNLKRIRMSKCPLLKTVNLKDMPQLEVVDILDNCSLIRANFINCPNLVCVDTGFCPQLSTLDGIENVKYLSMPYVSPLIRLSNMPIMANLLYIDFAISSVSEFQTILRSSPNLEVATVHFYRGEQKIKLSELTQHQSLRSISFSDCLIELDSVHPNTKLQFIESDIRITCERDQSIASHFFIANMDTNRNGFVFQNQPQPFKYQQIQKLLYGKWGVPLVDLEPPLKVNQIITPPQHTNASKALDSLIGAIFASAVFDMIGVGVEFLSESIAKARLVGPADITWTHPRVNRHNMRFVRGTPTDDTSQSVLIMRTIIDANTNRNNSDKTITLNGVEIDPVNFGLGLLEWIYNGHAEHKHPGGLGCGATTYKVITNSNFQHDPILASKQVWEASGKKVAPNGSVMRIASSGCFAFWDEDIVIANAEIYARVTHADPRCIYCSIGAALLIARYIQFNAGLLESEPNIDQTLEKAASLVSDLKNYEGDVAFYSSCKTLEDLDLAEPEKIGYCLKAFGSGIWALRYCKSILEGIEKIIPAAGDSDTNGAVVGALLGAKFGFSGIPPDFIDKMFTGHWLWREMDPFVNLMGFQMPDSPYA